MNEPNLRFAVIVITIFMHLVILVFVVFETEIIIQDKNLEPRIISLIDLDELLPVIIPHQPQPPVQPVQRQETDIPQVEAIAETMIESEDVPLQEIVEGGILRDHVEVIQNTAAPAAEETYLPRIRVTESPNLEREIAAISKEIIYPPILLRSGTEGRVILELFIDRTGIIRSVDIRLEDPAGSGFGEAAAAPFRNKRVTPATSEGEPVSFRMNFPFRFQIR